MPPLPTFALVSRMMNIDLPYQSEWFEYYDKLGVNHFYIYYHDSTFYDLESTLTYYPKSKVVLQKIESGAIKNPNELWIEFPFTIQDDYILHVDSDEYLYLQNMKLAQFVQKFPDFQYYSFLWYMCPSHKRVHHSLQEILDDKSLHKYFALYYKSMALRSHVEFLRDNSHDFLIKKSVQKRTFSNDFFIIYFSYRNQYDCYYKTFHQRILNHVDGKEDFIHPEKKLWELKEIPSRVLTYIGEFQNRNPKVYLPIHLHLSSTTNLPLLYSFEKDETKIQRFIERVEYLEKLYLFQNLWIQHKHIKRTIIDFAKSTPYIITFPS